MNQLTIIKIGGTIIDNDSALKKFLADFSKVEGMKILVHGGGKLATELSKKLGIEPKMLDGRRITDSDTLKVVTMVYAGWINKNIVAQLQASGCNAIGVCGADLNLIPAVKRAVKEIDYGMVGDVDSSQLAVDNPSERHLGRAGWQLLLKNGLTPVVAPVTHDGKGQLLNTNADTIASSLAIVLSKLYSVKLVYCFEKKGVLSDINDENSFFDNLPEEQYAALRQSKVIADGMIPKLDNAFNALNNGVSSVVIGHADNLLNMINNEKHAGTKLCK